MKVPLADRLRPQKLDEIVGQEHLVGDDGLITKLVVAQRPLSILLWGPPGCGKTTLARLYAKELNANFVAFSAVFSGVGDLRKVISQAKEQTLFQRHTILFVDEIHRFNKAQQDGFLPYLEDGTITLIGATTENPSFALNNALLSRIQVFTLNPLTNDALSEILQRYEDEHKKINLAEEARDHLIEMAQGDGRYLLNMIETLEGLRITDPQINVEQLRKALQRRAALFDKHGDGHYNLISALHKSMRGSDPDAALYWLARILESGEDPLFVARRLIRMATEDVGLADPMALQLAVAARDTYQMLGSPEGELALAETAVYLALAPKSNAIYVAYEEARKAAAETGHLSPPKHILNAPTKLMREQGYGKGYVYDHDADKGFSGQNYFPQDMTRSNFYRPVERGFEREMVRRIEYFNKLRN